MKDFENYEFSEAQYIEIHDTYEDEEIENTYKDDYLEVECEEVEIQDTYVE